MCNANIILFETLNISSEEVKSKRILEIGSRNVNGSIRPIVLLLKPSEYIGVDIMPGPDVDVLCKAENIINRFGPESFDVVISNEIIEHILDWRKVISNIKNICRPGGIIFLTTRSIGFPYHGYPYDFWRYENEDFKKIFSDFHIVKLENDNPGPGVMLKAIKPKDFRENDISDYSLYNIVLNERTKSFDERAHRHLATKMLINQILNSKIDYIFKKI